MINNQEQKQTIEVNPQIIQMLTVANQVFKIAMTNVLKEEEKSMDQIKEGEFQNTYLNLQK